MELPIEISQTHYSALFHSPSQRKVDTIRQYKSDFLFHNNNSSPPIITKQSYRRSNNTQSQTSTDMKSSLSSAAQTSKPLQYTSLTKCVLDLSPAETSHRTGGLKTTPRDYKGPHFDETKINILNMHQSSNRYFTQQDKSPTLCNRRKLMITDGLNHAKYSSVIGVGRNDIPSYGIEDQFSKSDYYMKKSASAAGGLCEVRTKSVQL